MKFILRQWLFVQGKKLLLCYSIYLFILYPVVQERDELSAYIIVLGSAYFAINGKIAFRSILP